MEHIDYELETGHGKTVIFIHGWLGSKEFWEHITTRLELENPFLTYDQRCHAQSNQEYTIEQLAEDLNQLIEELELENPVLVGHSMGGMTALKYASQYDNLSGLCLLGTCASTPKPENKSVKYFLEEFDNLDREEWAAKIADNYVSRPDNENIREMTRKELEAADEEPIKYGLRAMMQYDVRDELGNLETSALVVAAEHDGAITLEKSEELAELLDCGLRKVDTSHQMLPEAPEKIAGLISEFVKGRT